MRDPGFGCDLLARVCALWDGGRWSFEVGLCGFLCLSRVCPGSSPVSLDRSGSRVRPVRG